MVEQGTQKNRFISVFLCGLKLTPEFNRPIKKGGALTNGFGFEVQKDI
jgi:hypothetical protein